MGERLPDDEKQRLLDAVDLVALFGEDHQVERDGALHKVCCPFHEERTPSCTIYDDGHYHCYGCGAHGDAITYLMEHRGLDWDGAIADLRQRTNIEAPAAQPRERKRKANEVWIPITPVPDKAPKTPPPHFKKGSPESWYPYPNAEGHLLGGVARYPSQSQGKITPTWTWCRHIETGEERWRERRWDRPYPLYGLDLLAQRPDDPVLVVEGEKTANAARAMLGHFYVVVTHCGGHQAARHADWSVLEGRTVILWPDADYEWDDEKNKPKPKGVEAYRHLASLLVEEHRVDSVRFITLEAIASGLEVTVDQLLKMNKGKDGWDLADAPEGWASTAQAIIEAADGAGEPPAPPPATPVAGDDEPDDADQHALDRVLAEYPLTETGFADRLVKRYGGNFHYDWTRKTWIVWDGQRWADDITDQMMRWARETSQAMHREAQYAPEHSKGRKYHDAARKAQGRSRRTAMIEDARSYDGVTIRDRSVFNRDPYLVNCPNGTLDLRTAELRPHRRSDYLDSITAATYDREAQSDTLDRVLFNLCQKDSEMRDVLQMSLGSTLIAGNRGERIYLWTGAGNSGKTTLLEAVAAALGRQYATSAGMETFQVSFSEKIRSDIARLDGPRLVYADDGKDGVLLDEGILKRLSGRGRMVAAFKHANEFEFRPQFTPILAMNGAPVVRVDSGLERRLVRLNFEYAVPPDQRKQSVKDELIDPDRSGSAILAWLVRGARRFIETKGEIPARFIEYTKKSLRTSDPVSEFLSDWIEWRSDALVPVSEVRKAYVEGFCQMEGCKPLSSQQVNRRIEEMGGEREKRKIDGKSVSVWVGLTLSDEYSRFPVPEVPENPNSSPTHARAPSASSSPRALSEKTGTLGTGNQSPPTDQRFVDEEPPF